jgi:N utilization substance protein A
MMRILDSIARDRNIDRSLLIRDLEQAMVSAARKHFNTLDTEEFTCTLDPSPARWNSSAMASPRTARRGVWAHRRPDLQAGDDPEVPRRRARSIFEEFSKRVGEIVTGTAQRYEGGALVVTVDRSRGFMPRSEQIPGEQFARATACAA